MMLGYMLGGMAEGQKTREDMELRRNADARAQIEAEQMKRMREYQLADAEREADVDRRLSQVDEFQPLAEGADPSSPRSRRAQRDIWFDQARVMQQYGGQKGLARAMDFKTKAYDLDKREFDEGLRRIAQSSLPEGEKIRQLAEFTSAHAGFPGKLNVSPTEDGKFVVGGEDAAGQPLGGKVYNNFQQLYEAVQAGANFDNYIKTHELAMRRAQEADRAKLAPVQQRAAEAGATRAEVDARISTATEGSRTAAGNLAEARERAAIGKDNAGAAKEGALGRLYDRTDPNLRGGAGGGPRNPGKISVSVPDPVTGRTNKLELSVARDAKGNLSYTAPDGKPFTDTKLIERAMGYQDAEGRAAAEYDADLRAIRERFSRGTTDDRMRDQEIAGARLRYETNVARISYSQLGPADRADKVADMLRNGMKPDQVMSMVGASMQEVTEAQKRLKGATTNTPASSTPMSRPSADGSTRYGPLTPYSALNAAAQGGDPAALQRLRDLASDPYKLQSMPDPALEILARAGDLNALAMLRSRLEEAQ